MDESSESLEKLEYAKCMVDVSPYHALPDEFPVQMVDGSMHYVHVNYLWKPPISSFCNVFGHGRNGCVRHGKEE